MISLKNEYSEKLKKVEKIETIFALVRFVSLIASVIMILSGYFASKTYLYYCGAFLLIIFILSVVFHIKYYDLDKDLSYKLDIIAEYDKRKKLNLNSIKDDGLEFFDENNYFEADLDIFGKNSIYRYLNVARTGYGRYKFANALKDPDISEAEIKRRQDAAKELSQNKEISVDISSKLKNYEANVTDNKYRSMDGALSNVENEASFNKLMIIPAIFLEILLIVSIVLACLKIIPVISVIVVLVINFFATIYLSKPIKEVRARLMPINNLFYGYDKIIDSIISHEYMSDALNDVKKSLSKDASKGFRIFNKLEAWISSGNNIIFEILFNSLFSFDVFMMFAYSCWHNKYHKSIRGVVDNVSDMEMYLSLATLKLVNDDVIIPSISNEFKFKNLRHPLIKQDKVVGNDFEFSGMNIITGSNMSGKTTFMRSIGVAYILFKAGSFVSAREFEAGIYKLFTSMKVTDDVSSGISTFYAEILRINKIIKYIDEKKPTLVLVDEIFKGTNTLDRVKGAREVINTLNKDYVHSIITTHDFELCDTKGAKNYHFKEDYEDEQIKFDYKIYDGRSETTNAIYLLKMSGIIKE